MFTCRSQGVLLHGVAWRLEFRNLLWPNSPRMTLSRHGTGNPSAPTADPKTPCSSANPMATICSNSPPKAPPSAPAKEPRAAAPQNEFSSGRAGPPRPAHFTFFRRRLILPLSFRPATRRKPGTTTAGSSLPVSASSAFPVGRAASFTLQSKESFSDESGEAFANGVAACACQGTRLGDRDSSRGFNHFEQAAFRFGQA